MEKKDKRIKPSHVIGFVLLILFYGGGIALFIWAISGDDWTSVELRKGVIDLLCLIVFFAILYGLYKIIVIIGRNWIEGEMTYYIQKWLRSICDKIKYWFRNIFRK